LPEIAENFEDLIKIVNNSHGKYDFQLREDYSNVYHRGSSLAKVGRLKSGEYSVEIHHKYLQSAVLDEMNRCSEGGPHGEGAGGQDYLRFRVQPVHLAQFFQLAHLDDMACKIRQWGKKGEVVYEQNLMADNPPNETLILIDRQITDHSDFGKMDILALARDSVDEPFHFLVIEVKLGNNPELRNDVDEQLTRYVNHVAIYIEDYGENYQENYRQKKIMGLFGVAMPDEIRIDHRVRGMVVVGGYPDQAKNATDKLRPRYPDLVVQVMEGLHGTINPDV